MVMDLEMDILAGDRIMVQRGDRNQLCLHSLKRAGDSSEAFVMPPKVMWVADILHRAQENRYICIRYGGFIIY